MNLLPDAVGFVKIIKQAAVDAVESEKPVNVCFGEVISVTPLKINVEQKLVLGEAQLILTRNVTDYNTQVTIDWITEKSPLNVNHTHTGEVGVNVDTFFEPENKDITIVSSATGNITIAETDIDLLHNHAVSGKKKITIHNGLGIGDEVIMIRQQKGQKYIVIDRIGAIE